MLKWVSVAALVPFVLVGDQTSDQTHIRARDICVSDAAGALELENADSLEFTGPDSASLTVPCDVSLNSVSIEPDHRVDTFYGQCLMTTNTLIWKNVSLEDVTSFSASMGGSGVGSQWRKPQFVGNSTTNSNGDITVQFQYKNGPLYMIAVTYSQSGEDVVAKVSRSLYQYNYNLGGTFSGIGSARTLTNTVDGAHLAICELGCTLRETANQMAVNKFTVSNSDPDESSYETESVYGTCLMTTNAVVWKNTDLSKVTGFSAQMAGRALGTTWVDVSAYCFKTNSDGSISCQFQYVKPPTDKNILYSATVLFRQFGADVYGRITRFVYQYYKEVGTDLSSVGSSATVTDTPGASAMALRNITGTWQRPYRYEYEETNPNCLTNIPATVWKDVRLADVTAFTARIGGSQAGSEWRTAASYNQKTNATTGAVTCQFQIHTGKNICAIVQFLQIGDDVEAKVTRTCYQYDPLGTDLSEKGQAVACVDTVDGTGIALKDVSCTRLRRVPHTVTFNGFDPNDTPVVRLEDIDILLSGAEQGDAIMPRSVRCRGAVKAGYVTITNACEITADGGLVTLPDSTLCFDMTAMSTDIPSLAVSRAGISSGTSILLYSDTVLPEALDGDSRTLLAGGGLSQDVLQNLSLSFAGALKGRCRGELSVDENGDLSVIVRKIRGTVISVR